MLCFNSHALHSHCQHNWCDNLEFFKGGISKKRERVFFSPCLKKVNNIVMERVSSLNDSIMNGLKMEELNEGIIN